MIDLKWLDDLEKHTDMLARNMPVGGGGTLVCPYQTLRLINEIRRSHVEISRLRAEAGSFAEKLAHYVLLAEHNMFLAAENRRLKAELEPLQGVLNGVAKTWMNPLDVVSISKVACEGT